MKQSTPDNSLGDGVYYEPSDYVGFFPRIVIHLVDSIALTILLAIIALTWVFAVGAFTTMFLVLSLFVIWAYEVPLRRSRFGTAGFWLMGCKLVTLQGAPPSLIMLTYRTFLLNFGPFYPLFDLIWCGMDDDRQTIRDRFSSTCLVKKSALPLGTGAVQLAHFHAFNYNLIYPWVVRQKAVLPKNGGA